MNLLSPLRRRVGAFFGLVPAADAKAENQAILALAEQARLAEAATGVQVPGEDDHGWTRLSGAGTGSASGRDLTPMSQDFMQRSAEFIWQSTVLANRLIELPLAFLLAEGVQLQCADATHQKLLTRFWLDPINDWPTKLMSRVRDLALMGEQCYAIFRNEADGFVRLGYVDPRLIANVVTDPDNPEQPIGVITKRDAKGRYRKYRVYVAGPDEELFSERARAARAGFGDGEVMLFQVNKLATGSRGRSDLLHLIDWIDAYDGFLFGELDRTGYLRAFVWDLELESATPTEVTARAASFKPPAPNSAFVHNKGEKLTAVAPELQAADASVGARLFRNHILAGATFPEHWAGGGGDVNRAAASEMGEPTFKMLTARQSMLKLMLESIGRMVLASQPNAEPDWSSPKWKVTAVFPELVSRDLTKFAAALQGVCGSVLLLIDKGLLTEETGLTMVADVAQRFGQTIDAKAELEKAREQRRQREEEKAGRDAFHTPGLGDDAGDDKGGSDGGAPGGPPAGDGSAQP